MSNIITVAGDNPKKKKGGGVNAVLVLLKDLGDFQDKVQSCIEAQDIADSRAKIEAFYDQLDSMSQTLLDMAGDGIRSRRSPEGHIEQSEEHLEDQIVEEPVAATVHNTSTVNAPTTPRMPR